MKPELAKPKRRPAWLRAVTRPTFKTYTHLVSSAPSGLAKSAMWAFFSGAAGAAIPASFVLVDLSISLGSAPIAAAIVSLVGTASAILLIASAFLTRAIGTWVGGSGQTASLAYLLVAFTAPMTLLAGIVSYLLLASPGTYSPAVLILLYPLYLTVLATRAALALSWARAAISAVPALLLQVLTYCLVPIPALLILVAAISNAWRRIIP